MTTLHGYAFATCSFPQLLAALYQRQGGASRSARYITLSTPTNPESSTEAMLEAL